MTSIEPILFFFGWSVHFFNRKLWKLFAVTSRPVSTLSCSRKISMFRINNTPSNANPLWYVSPQFVASKPLTIQGDVSQVQAHGTGVIFLMNPRCLQRLLDFARYGVLPDIWSSRDRHAAGIPPNHNLTVRGDFRASEFRNKRKNINK